MNQASYQSSYPSVMETDQEVDLTRSGWTGLTEDCSDLGTMLYEATQLTENRGLWRHTVYDRDCQHAKILLSLPRYRRVTHRVTILQASRNSQLFSQIFTALLPKL